MPQVRKSRQRDAILCNLQNRCDHPTAMELYLSVREEIPNLSLGTMYRNLNTLCKDGQILRLSDGGEEHYDATAHSHAHLKCECCGEIRGCSLIFFGVCANCHRQTEQNI